MAAVKGELEQQLRIAYATGGDPSAEDIIKGIKARSDVANKNGWNPVRMAGGILINFPSKQSLNFFCDRSTSWSCSNGAFRVKKWTGKEETRSFNFLYTAWIRIKGLPIFAWTRDGLIKILCSYGYVLEVDTSTLDRSRLDFARDRVGGRRREELPSKVEVVLDGRLATLNIEVEEDSIQKFFHKKLTFTAESSIGGAPPPSQARKGEQPRENSKAKSEGSLREETQPEFAQQAELGFSHTNPNLVCNQMDFREDAERRRYKGKELDTDPPSPLTNTRMEAALTPSPRISPSEGAGGCYREEGEGSREKHLLGMEPKRNGIDIGLGPCGLGLARPNKTD